MTDRPILFSGPMVRALLDGRKTQTRRVLNPQPPADMGLVGIYAPKLTAVFGYETPDADHKVALRFMPGDRLWVRETWRPVPCMNPWDMEVIYNANGEHRIIADGEFGDKDWNMPKAAKHGNVSPLFMPRWASRLTLIVADVRVQRLREISEEDARAEGMTGEFCDYELYGQSKPFKYEFSALWDSINAARGFGWDANPWVVAVSFSVERRNIDQVRS